MTGALAGPAAASTGERVAPGSPAPESKIQGGQLTGAEAVPQGYFVQFAGEPTSMGGSLSAIQAERQAFASHVADTGLDVEVRHEFGSLWNGVSVTVDESDLLEVASSGVVEAIFPIAVIDAPEQPEATTIDPQLHSAVTMTGADIAQSELGLDGAGIRVGIIDSGIDIDHPDLGGGGTPGGTSFPTQRIPFGYDFVGDDFNADPSSEAYQPNPRPDRNPDDCGGHGTHVAGIVGADGEVTGVAPGVTFGAYRVFGCDGSTDGDIMLRAMERALADRMDVVNMSIGSAFTAWAEYPTAQASDALAREGVVVVASIGNSGANGLHSAGAPGVGKDTIGVGSVDNVEYMANVFVAESGESIPYTVGSPAPEPPTSGTVDVVAVDEPGTAGATACGSDPFSAEEKALIDGNWVLIQRGGPAGGEACSFHEKARNGQAAGAAGVIIYNNTAGMINPSLAGTPAITVPTVAISQADGAELVAAALADGSTEITWTEGEQSIPSATGGLMSSFSSFGTTADLRYKPDLSAPGGQIYSTYPLEIQAHATLSGTSMAAPHVAGAAALLLQDDRDLSVTEVKARLQNSSEQLPLSVLPAAGLEVVHRQGAGMIQIDRSILADVVIEPSLLDLGQQLPGVDTTHTMSLTNTTATAQTYTLSFESAIATQGTANDWGYYVDGPSVTFSQPTVTVPAEGSASVEVTVTSPEDEYLFGGFVRATGAGGDVYSVPVGGASFDLQQVEVLADQVNAEGETTQELPALATLAECGRFLGIDCVDPEAAWDVVEGDTVYTMDEGDVPTLLVHFEHQARAMEWEVFRATPTGAKGASLGTVAEVDYLGRSATRNGFSAYTWDGMVVDDSGARERVADGRYVLEVTVTKAQAWNVDGPAGVETWTSPAFGVAFSGTGLEDAPAVDRAQGLNRYSTAAELAVENYETGLDTVYIGSGSDFPDALSGGALAGAEGAPVLLSQKTFLPSATRMALQSLQPQRIVVVGGERAVEPVVLEALRSYAPVVERLAGENRWETSVAVSSQHASADLVFLASGLDYADALSATAPAGVEGAPVLLAKQDQIPSAVIAELRRLNPETIVVVGGTDALNGDVMTAASAYADEVVRIGGANRYETAVNMAATFFDVPTAHAMLATGQQHADALAAGPVAAMKNGPVMLTRGDKLTSATLEGIVEQRVQNILIVGGYEAVVLAVQEELEELVYP